MFFETVHIQFETIQSRDEALQKMVFERRSVQINRGTVHKIFQTIEFISRTIDKSTGSVQLFKVLFRPPWQRMSSK